jgi:Fe2+ or Zn2+ uptake regulation protein
MSDPKETIDKIRDLLDSLERGSQDDEARLFAHNFDALELPAIVATIVDVLQPLLLPYEAAVYWYLFRNSIIGTGQQYVRASTRGLMEGVIQSASGQSQTLSYASVQQTLSGLEKKGVISKIGDTNRAGTLYKVNLPEEIEACQAAIKNRDKKEPTPIDEKRELDYYNVAENRLRVYERDQYKCRYCEKQLTRFTATLDHLQPVSEGGDNSYDNLSSLQFSTWCAASNGGVRHDQTK